MAVATDDIGVSDILDFLTALGESQIFKGLRGGLGLYSAYSDLGKLGKKGLSLGTELGEDLLSATQFRPYGITTATGSGYNVGIGPDGQLTSTMTLSPEEQKMRDNLMTQAKSFYDLASVDPSVRENQLYQQIQEATAPQQMAERLGLEERLAAQGRLGVQTAAFGGTPEALAMEKAQQQTLAQARLTAAQQARQEQAGLAALGQQMFGASYLPQAQLLSGLQPGLTSAGQAQQAQLYGAGLFGQARASGIDALLAAGQGRGNIVGAAATGLLSGLFG